MVPSQEEAMVIKAVLSIGTPSQEKTSASDQEIQTPQRKGKEKMNEYCTPTSCLMDLPQTKKPTIQLETSKQTFTFQEESLPKPTNSSTRPTSMGIHRTLNACTTLKVWSKSRRQLSHKLA